MSGVTRTFPPGPGMAEDAARAFNQRLAAAYDAEPYDRGPTSGIEPRFILGAAALMGGVTSADGVLDIGCGVGTALGVAANVTNGPLVGVDISRTSCAIARERLATHGERVKIVHADLMDLAPQDLGQFDLIYLVGLIYVAPAEVRAKALDLAAACLKPGGCLVITYYAGVVPLIRSWVHRLLKPYPRQDGPLSNTISFMRGDLAALREDLGAKDPANLARIALNDLIGLPDQEFEHEVFGAPLDIVQTHEIEALMAPHGVRFCAYLHGPFHASAPSSQVRALKTDAYDLRLGGYRTALFVKTAHDGPFDVSTPGVLWATSLPLRDEGADRDAPYITQTGAQLTFHNPLIRAAIESLHDGYKTFDELWADLQLREPEAAGAPEAREALQSDMRQLLIHAYLRPIANPYFRP